jgi:glutaredoxin 2
MNNEHKYIRHEILTKQANEVYRKKNEAYGDSFGKTFQKYGIISALTRMSDKWGRIEALILGARNEVTDEALEDTLMDLANYCYMTIIEIEESKKVNA